MYSGRSHGNTDLSDFQNMIRSSASSYRTEETAVLDVEPIPTEEFRYRPQERGHNHINRSGYVGSRPSEVSNGFSGGGGGGYVSRYNGANQRFNGGGRGRGGASIGYNGGYSSLTRTNYDDQNIQQERALPSNEEMEEKLKRLDLCASSFDSGAPTGNSGFQSSGFSQAQPAKVNNVAASTDLTKIDWMAPTTMVEEAAFLSGSESNSRKNEDSDAYVKPEGNLEKSKNRSEDNQTNPKKLIVSGGDLYDPEPEKKEEPVGNYATSSVGASKVPADKSSYIQDDEKMDEMPRKLDTKTNERKTTKNLDKEEEYDSQDDRRALRHPLGNRRTGRRYDSELSSDDEELPRTRRPPVAPQRRKERQVDSDDERLPRRRKERQVDSDEERLPRRRKDRSIDSEDERLPRRRKDRPLDSDEEYLTRRRKERPIDSEDERLPRRRKDRPMDSDEEYASRRRKPQLSDSEEEYYSHRRRQEGRNNRHRRYDSESEVDEDYNKRSTRARQANRHYRNRYDDAYDDEEDVVGDRHRRHRSIPQKKTYNSPDDEEDDGAYARSVARRPRPEKPRRRYNSSEDEDGDDYRHAAKSSHRRPEIEKPPPRRRDKAYDSEEDNEKVVAPTQRTKERSPSLRQASVASLRKTTVPSGFEEDADNERHRRKPSPDTSRRSRNLIGGRYRLDDDYTPRDSMERKLVTALGSDRMPVPAEDDPNTYYYGNKAINNGESRVRKPTTTNEHRGDRLDRADRRDRDDRADRRDRDDRADRRDRDHQPGHGTRDRGSSGAGSVLLTMDLPPVRGMGKRLELGDDDMEMSTEDNMDIDQGTLTLVKGGRAKAIEHFIGSNETLGAGVGGDEDGRGTKPTLTPTTRTANVANIRLINFDSDQSTSDNVREEVPIKDDRMAREHREIATTKGNKKLDIFFDDVDGEANQGNNGNKYGSPSGATTVAAAAAADVEVEELMLAQKEMELFRIQPKPDEAGQVPPPAVDDDVDEKKEDAQQQQQVQLATSNPLPKNLPAGGDEDVGGDGAAPQTSTTKTTSTSKSDEHLNLLVEPKEPDEAESKGEQSTSTTTSTTSTSKSKKPPPSQAVLRFGLPRADLTVSHFFLDKDLLDMNDAQALGFIKSVIPGFTVIITFSDSRLAEDFSRTMQSNGYNTILAINNGDMFYSEQHGEKLPQRSLDTRATRLRAKHSHMPMVTTIDYMLAQTDGFCLPEFIVNFDLRQANVERLVVSLQSRYHEELRSRAHNLYESKKLSSSLFLYHIWQLNNEPMFRALKAKFGDDGTD